MNITIDIPHEVEAVLRSEWGDLDRAAKDALLIESYRTGRISIGYLSQILGVSRWDAERWLGERGINWNYGIEDLKADRRTLDELDSRNR